MRNFDLSPLYRSAIGFDRLFNHLENNQSQSNGGYPPYNVELVDENHYRIAIAVAGFAESVDKFLAFNEYQILEGYGNISREQAEQKVLAEYEKFNKQQRIESDFDRQVKKLLNKGSADAK